MNRQELYVRAYSSNIFRRWHWFRYHFECQLRGKEHPFAASLLDALVDVDNVMPGFASAMLDAVADISGIERYRPHYEQLLQRLAEVLVLRQLVAYRWDGRVTFEREPRATRAGSNPEILLTGPAWSAAVEVKAPSLLQHAEQRSANPWQLTARLPDALQMLPGDPARNEVTWPRDNPVKDFLTSADSKFAALRQRSPDVVGLLVVVWDDFVNEPLSALLAPSSGLLTDQSFARDAEGRRRRFEHVDGVVLVRHLHQFQRAAGDQLLVDGRSHAMDYGQPSVLSR